MSFSRQQWRVLIILMLVNFCNYVDRQIVFPLFPLIRNEFSLTYFQVESLAAAFSIVHALAMLPFGMLARPDLAEEDHQLGSRDDRAQGESECTKRSWRSDRRTTAGLKGAQHDTRVGNRPAWQRV